MFPQLIVVDGINDQPGQPSWLGPALCHNLSGQLAEGVAIFLRGLCGDLQRTLGFRVVRCQKNPAVGFNSQDPVTGLEPESIGHVFWQRGTDGPARLSKGHFFRHAGMVAY